MEPRAKLAAQTAGSVRDKASQGQKSALAGRR